MRILSALAVSIFFLINNPVYAQNDASRLTFKGLDLGVDISFFKEKFPINNCGKKSSGMTVCTPEVGVYANKRIEKTTAFFINEKLSRVELIIYPGENSESLQSAIADIFGLLVIHFGGPSYIGKQPCARGFRCMEYVWDRKEEDLILTSHKVEKNTKMTPKKQNQDFITIEISIRNFTRMMTEAARANGDPEI